MEARGEPGAGTLTVTEEQLGSTEELRGRQLSGRWWLLARVVGVAMALYHVAVLGFYSTDPQKMYAFHLMFASLLVFLLLPARKGQGSATPTAWDLLLALASVGVVVYQLLFFSELTNRAGVLPTLADVGVGVLLLVVVVEMVRRTSGWAMPILGGLFVLYAFLGPYLPSLFRHNGFPFSTTISFLFSDNGIYSAPIAASARYVYLFILFGAFLEASGIGKFIVNLGLSLAGHRRGGPAKVSILTSALFGTASGSSAANVMVDGVINVPLMKSTGFRPSVAGAIEAMNSTGGQLVPPVMGAAAFLMADILGVPYSRVALSALIPALLYYVAAYWMIDFYSARNGLRGLPRDRLPKLGAVLVQQGFLLGPLALILVLIMGFDQSPFRAALWGLAATVVASWAGRGERVAHPWVLLAAVAYGVASRLGAPSLWSFLVGCAAVAGVYAWRPEARDGIRRLVDALYDGSWRSVEIAATTAAAGMVVGILSLTGLGGKLSLALLTLAGGNVLLMLGVAMLVALLLGMGLPTTAAYAIMASTLAPALVQAGIPPMAAHLFLFYFACLSALTPPVALASFAAASLARAPMWETGWQSVRFALAGFIVPYMFVFGPALLMQGHWYEVLWAVVTGTIGTLCLGGAVVGYLLRPADRLERLLLFGAALLLIKPGLLTDTAGFGLLAAVVALQRLRTPVTVPQPGGVSTERV
ncbi:MAG: TRAP transporter fused permease subunit [Armatimonadota bacterium]|nr:TRAP transporter fused permease subunit [Armatimonadota bacterium]MDR7428536.1 TRAP transporter fused permease subunit [Armatimonadota bacterium]MDR7432912.1 TRAP transporter fused permease subunit [Armatimonadota bacterium]MDR7462597.1 TRAP transporter fused permease subunit [Armatimonadota bacterium]MDR7476673.1 TRAP transporter fused permease subunit [Armatimonadota bacterium]